MIALETSLRNVLTAAQMLAGLVGLMRESFSRPVYDQEKIQAGSIRKY
jgi:hypothetical protein